MVLCSGCAGSLIESVDVENEYGVFKSCPECSRRAGYHIFYRFEDFGMRNMGDGRYIVQSWCPGCRLDDGITPEIQFVCNTAKS